MAKKTTKKKDKVSVISKIAKEDPFNLINTALLKKGRIKKSFVSEIPWSAFSREPFEKKEVRDEAAEIEEVIKEREMTAMDKAHDQFVENKIHPALRKLIAERTIDSNDEKQEILINFHDDLILPRFPEPNLSESRKSVYNRKVLKYKEKLVGEITDHRTSKYKKMISDLGITANAKVIDTFWLINAMLVEMPLNRVREMAQLDEVAYIEPRNAGEEPPSSNSNPNDDVDDGRTRIVSDPYFNLGLTKGWIGLLDTGLRFTHTLFNSPSHIDFRRDCINGGADCNTGTGLDPTDDCWNHGTSSAAIISGNNNLGNAYRGVTGVTLDSFKVYPNSCGGLDSAAVVRGFQAAVGVLDRVIVAEMQGGGSDTSTISTAADNAFDAGAVIIAANGNNGPNSGTVNTPANAHKVIGVGNFDVQTQTQITSQSRGPAPDNRFKPDIQAPTNTETASSSSNSALRVFGGTSGATPYAAGAATLLRNWLRGNNFSIDPGQVYAHLILSGQQPYPFNNTAGAGPINLPTDGWAWWGKVSVHDGVSIDIPISFSGAGLNNFDGALWWPETPAQKHNDVDLYLIDPTGTQRASSISINSIFERARISGRIAAGTWTFRIRGYSVPTGAQTVYWAAHVRLG